PPVHCPLSLHDALPIFDQGSLIERNIIRNGMDPVPVYGDLLSQSAPITSQADEVLVRAQMVIFFTPIFFADHIWFNNDMLANLEVINASAYRAYRPRKFLPQVKGCFLA